MTTEKYQPEPLPEELLQTMRAEEIGVPEDIALDIAAREAESAGEGIQPAVTAEEAEDLSDLFQAPLPGDSDIASDDLTSVSEEDVYGDGGADMSDLTDIDEDMFEVGPEPEEAPRPMPRYRIKPKSIRRRDNGGTPSMGGLRL